jgi:hypothetical protein
VKHSRYVPYWIDSSNPVARSKWAPAGLGGHASSDEPHLSLLSMRPLVLPLPCVRWIVEVEAEVRAKVEVMVGAYLCA